MLNMVEMEALRSKGADQGAAEADNPVFSTDPREITRTLSKTTAKDKDERLGTVMGVLVPCLANILGVLLFLRLPFIAGEAGIGLTLLIVFLSALTTTLTTLSMSAIATNGQIEGGGSYFLISRSLGPQFGAAVGISFFLGTSASCAMYILGAVEAMQASFSVEQPSTFQTQFYGIIFLTALFLIVYFGTKFVARVGPVGLGFVFLGVISVFVGLFLLGTDASTYEEGDAIGYRLKSNWDSAFTSGNTFGSLLSLFFPSVTGIMAGANRSAVLKDPSTSIPKGTLTAIAITTTLYFIWPIFFGSAIERETLQQDTFIVPKVAWPVQEVVQIAILFSSLGAGLQSLSGAPQLLNAISNDFKGEVGIFTFLAQPADNPRRCLLTTASIVFGLVMLGDLDAVAPITTMFLLLCYMTVNIACVLLSVLDRPSWRPSFKAYHWTTAASGSILCFALMLIDQWVFAIIAIAFAFMLYKYIGYKNVKRDWGDGVRGFKYAEAANAILELGSAEHVNNWRPQWLVLYKLGEDEIEPEDWRLLELARHFGGKTMMQIVGVMEGEVEDVETYRSYEARFNTLVGNWISSTKARALSRVVSVPDVNLATPILLQSVGIGVLTPNIVLLAWPKQWEKERDERDFFATSLKACERFSKAAVVVMNPDGFPVVGSVRREREQAESANSNSSSGFLDDLKDLWNALVRVERGGKLAMKGTIDIWWEREDGGLMIMLAVLLRRHRMWHKCKIRLFTTAFALENSIAIQRKLENYLKRIRVRATVTVVEFDDTNITPYVIQRSVDVQMRHDLLKQLEVVKSAEDGKTIASKHEFKVRDLSELARERYMVQREANLIPTLDATAVLRQSDTKEDIQERLAELLAKDEENLEEAMKVRVIKHNEEEEIVGEIKADGELVTTAEQVRRASAEEDRKVASPSLKGLFADPSADAESKSEESQNEDDSRIEEASEMGAGSSSSEPSSKVSPVKQATSPVKVLRKMSEEKLDADKPKKENGDHIPSLEDEVHVPKVLPGQAKRMATAVRYNEVMKEHSSDAALIITNLPSLSIYKSNLQFLSFTEVLTEGLPRIVLVKGTKHEVITTYI